MLPMTGWSNHCPQLPLLPTALKHFLASHPDLQGLELKMVSTVRTHTHTQSWGELGAEGEGLTAEGQRQRGRC